MDSDTVFRAPWGTLLKSMTALGIVILVTICLIGISSGPRGNTGWMLGMIAMPLFILMLSVFFIIRGYVLRHDALLVQRLGWNSKLYLEDLISAEVDPEAMSESRRTFGNGGMFCIAGAFKNKKLGAYRAFATDPRRSVVLKFPNRTVVVTPGNPDQFVTRLEEIRNL